MTKTDVLIVGAGPTGLVLALWLTKQGIGVRIVDKSDAPGTTSRALAVQARTLELYRQLDLAEDVVNASYKNPGLNFWVNGKRRAHVSFDKAGKSLTPYPFILIYPQDQHERLLIDRLEKLGVTVERSTELLDLEEKEDGIVARLNTPHGEEQCEARYLAGCDGARSTVRHAIGSEFEGSTYDHLFYVADIESAKLPPDGIHISLESTDYVLLFPYGDLKRARLIGVVRQDRSNSEKLTFEDVRHQAIQALHLEIERVNWFSTYRVHHRVTHLFRKNHVFLLGDAAHVHSPVGGQGMNTGIGDAINLAWKLAAVIKGQASSDLLDSYEPERSAFARRLVNTTDRVFTVVTSQSRLATFMRTRVAPIAAAVLSRVQPALQFIFRTLSQTLLNYRESKLSRGKAGRVSGGDRLPWVSVDGKDNYDSLQAIQWQVHVYGSAGDGLKRWCEDHKIALHVFPWTRKHKAAGLLKNASYLLRPDTYVALADHTASVQVLDRYLVESGLSL